MTIFTKQRSSSPGYLEEYEAPLGEYLGATAEEEFVRSPLASIMRQRELMRAERGVGSNILDYNPFGDQPPSTASEMTDATTARARIKDEGLDLTVPDTGIRQRALDILIERKSEERRRQDILSRGPSGVLAGTARLGMSLAVSAIDPLNVASAFIPVVGEARYAAMLGRAGSALGRVAVRARVGAIEGAVGAAVVEPLVYGPAQQEQADYDLTDSLLNISLGTALGGGLHVGAGAVADAFRSGRGWQTARAVDAPIPRILEQVDQPTREAALRAGVAQAVTGRNIDVEPVVRSAARSIISPKDEAAVLSSMYPGLRDVAAPMAKEEAAAWYRTTGYAQMNKWAREGIFPDNLSGADIGSASAAIKAFARDAEPLETPLSVYRGQVGESLPRGFVSFTSDPAIADQHARKMRDGEVIKRVLPAGTRVVNIGGRESEILLLPKGLSEGMPPTMEGRPETMARGFTPPTDIRTKAEASFQPEAQRLYDGETVRIADQRLAEAPKDDATPDVTLEEAVEDVQRLAESMDGPIVPEPIQSEAVSQPRDIPTFITKHQTFIGQQPARDFDEIYSIAPANQARLEDAGQRIAKEVGAEFKSAGLKSRATAEGKISRKGYRSTGQITDIVRGGFIARVPAQAEAVIAALSREFKTFDEEWKVNVFGWFYRKVLVQFDDGMIGEVQLWEPNLYAAKAREGEKLYDEARALPPGDPRREELAQKQIELYSEALRSAEPDWGNFKSPNALLKAASETTEPLSPTSAQLTSVQPAPGESTAQARPSSMTAGRPSQLMKRGAIEGNVEVSGASIKPQVSRGAFSDLVARELAPFDELATTAEIYGRAVRAAAECGLRRG